jgi:hypothetical protein
MAVLLCKVAFMLNVANKPSMLNGIILSVVMLSVANKPYMLSVIYSECHK